MTKIEWAEKTWNPVIGCSKISAGCDNCYAERMAYRLAHMQTPGYSFVSDCHTKKWNGRTYFRESELEKPLNWKKSRRIFVSSMGDLFHESVNIRGEAIRSIFRLMAKTCHNYMILTKRPERMADCIDYIYGGDFAEVMPHIWLGVTVENQDYDWRIKKLLQIPAVTRFVSLEPMLGPVNLEPYLQYPPFHDHHKMTCGLNDWRGLDWVICGGESGPGARPMHPDWVRSLRDQCQSAEVPFFFKQWGEWAPVDINDSIPDHVFLKGPAFDGAAWKVGKKKAGRQLDGQTHDAFPG